MFISGLKIKPIHAVFFGLSDDLAGELSEPLAGLCAHIQSFTTDRELTRLCSESGASPIIFCGADSETVTRLRKLNPRLPIVVVSRHAEVASWLDSIEAGATDYCAAPFEASQMKWILETSMRLPQQAPAAA